MLNVRTASKEEIVARTSTSVRSTTRVTNTPTVITPSVPSSVSVTPGIRSTMPLSVKVLYPQVMNYIPSCRAATAVALNRYSDVAKTRNEYVSLKM